MLLLKSSENSVALDQSNSDPEGRAQQLEAKSRGEMKTINSHRGLHTHTLSLLRFRFTQMKTLLEILETPLITEEGRGGGEVEGRKR